MGEMRFQPAGSCRRQNSLLTRVRRVGSRRRRKKACRGTFRLLRAHQRVGNACRANGRSCGAGAHGRLGSACQANVESCWKQILRAAAFAAAQGSVVGSYDRPESLGAAWASKGARPAPGAPGRHGCLRGGPARRPGLPQSRSLGALGLAWELGRQAWSLRSSWSSWPPRLQSASVQLGGIPREGLAKLWVCV